MKKKKFSRARKTGRKLSLVALSPQDASVLSLIATLPDSAPQTQTRRLLGKPDGKARLIGELIIDPKSLAAAAEPGWSRIAEAYRGWVGHNRKFAYDSPRSKRRHESLAVPSKPKETARATRALRLRNACSS